MMERFCSQTLILPAKHMKRILIPIIMCLMATVAQAVSVGESVDAFRLRDTEGTFHSDADYRGKVLILAVIGYN